MSAARLSKAERFERIIAELRARSTVRIAELAERFGVSGETVRRDIDELTRRGLVDRTYGGAISPYLAQEPAVTERIRVQVEERSRIGALAARMIESGDIVMVDSGSTTTHFARHLAARAVKSTVLTNCLGVALALGQAPDTRVLLCPGDYDAREGGTFGPEATAFLERFHASKAVIGASGITTDGPVEANPPASWVKRTMLARSERRILLVDHSKFELRALEIVCALTALDDLITDAKPPASLWRALKAAKVAISVAR